MTNLYSIDISIILCTINKFSQCIDSICIILLIECWWKKMSKIVLKLVKEICDLKNSNALLVQQVTELEEKNSCLKMEIDYNENGPDILSSAIEFCNSETLGLNE